MSQAVRELLPFAIGVAIVPIPVIAVILMLFSESASVNAPAFLVGWSAGLTAAFVGAYLLAEAGGVGTSSRAADGGGWLRIALGGLLLLLAGRVWRKRPAPGAGAELPRWMAAVDSLAPGKALGLGFALAALNPKNLALTISAAVGLVELDLSTGDDVAGLVAFVLIGSLSVGLPVVYSLAGGVGARSALDELKGWLALHDRAIVAVLLLVFGVVLISRGLAPLTG
ncbi:MAG: GAP family protein [Thermoleophilia bacterium]|nr:GAP family protein [Thermoleophilia bacterium]